MSENENNFTGLVFDVSLVDVGESKSDVIKALIHVGSEHPSSAIAHVPTVIKRDLTEIQAEKAKAILEFTGAKAEVQSRRFVDGIPSEQWHVIREEEGRKIDPATAVVISEFVNVADPYGIYLDLLEEEKCIGRVQFARRPEGDVWVSFYDLPDATCDAIRNRLRDTPSEDDDLPWLDRENCGDQTRDGDQS